MGARPKLCGAYSPTKSTSTKGTNSPALYIHLHCPSFPFQYKTTLDYTSETFSQKPATPSRGASPPSQSRWYTHCTQGSGLQPLPSRMDSLLDWRAPRKSTLHCPFMGPLRPLPPTGRYSPPRKQRVRQKASCVSWDRPRHQRPSPDACTHCSKVPFQAPPHPQRHPGQSGADRTRPRTPRIWSFHSRTGRCYRRHLSGHV